MGNQQQKFATDVKCTGNPASMAVYDACLSALKDDVAAHIVAEKRIAAKAVDAARTAAEKRIAAKATRKAAKVVWASEDIARKAIEVERLKQLQLFDAAARIHEHQTKQLAAYAANTAKQQSTPHLTKAEAIAVEQFMFDDGMEYNGPYGRVLKTARRKGRMVIGDSSRAELTPAAFEYLCIQKKLRDLHASALHLKCIMFVLRKHLKLLICLHLHLLKCNMFALQKHLKLLIYQHLHLLRLNLLQFLE